MIVKMQLPLGGNAPPQALVYNKNRSVEALIPVTASILKAMDGRPKAFFYTSFAVHDSIDLTGEAPWQDW